MKKIKLYTPLIVTASLVTAVTPLITLTSCGKGNLMKEYTPSIKPEDAQWHDTQTKVVDHYLQVCSSDKEIFKQDLMYTLSRGIPQYEAFVSEFCDVKQSNYNVKIDDINVDVTSRKVSFIATIKISYDYGNTKTEELKWYQLKYKKLNSTTKARFVFDFDTSSFDKDDITGLTRQMTSYAGAVQLGISEFGSTAQLISEKGSGTDLNGKNVKIDIKEPGELLHFILPSEGYWERQAGGLEKFHARTAECARLWENYWGVQSFILILKYYMPSKNDLPQGSLIPKSLDFGSYYLQNANLKDIYTIKDTTVYGFNLSLDSIKTLTNLKKDPTVSKYDINSKQLTLPETEPLHNIANHAFDSESTPYTNASLPDEIEKLVIPASYYNYGNYAFSSNVALKEIKFNLTGTPVGQGSYAFGSHAFHQLRGVKVVDFTSWDKMVEPTSFSVLDQKNPPFETIHLGNAAPTESEGTIYIPAGISEMSNWKSALTLLGFNLKSDANPTGWEVISGRPE